jgi:hypothetical protein
MAEEIGAEVSMRRAGSVVVGRKLQTLQEVEEKSEYVDSHW